MLILVGITHVLDDVVFQPFVLGGAVNIHPLVVVVAIIAGSLIMGLWGMVFAIPTVVVVDHRRRYPMAFHHRPLPAPPPHASIAWPMAVHAAAIYCRASISDQSFAAPRLVATGH